MARCDFANARLGARRSRFLGPTGLRELLTRPSLEARLDLLRASAYGPVVPPPGSGADSIAALERGLAALCQRELLRIAADLEGRLPRRLLRAWLALDEAEALKTVFRGLARAEPVDRILSLAEPTPGLGWDELRALASAPSAAEGVGRLAAARSPFAPAAAGALPGLGRPGGAARLEVALDRVAYERAFEAARGRGEDRRVLARLVALRADLANAATLLKLEGTGLAAELFLPGGRRLPERRFRELAGLPRPDLPAAVSPLLPGPALRAGAAEAMARHPGADHLFRRALELGLRREARRRPLSVAVPLSFLQDRRAEMRRIRLVLRGAEFGLPADDFVTLLEA